MVTNSLKFGPPYTSEQMPKVRERIEEVRSYVQGMEHMIDQYNWDYASPLMIQELRARFQESLRIINSIMLQKIVIRRKTW